VIEDLVRVAEDVTEPMIVFSAWVPSFETNVDTTEESVK
jgi:hypothetical protein